MDDQGQIGQPPGADLLTPVAVETSRFLKNFIPAEDPPLADPPLGNLRVRRWLVSRDYPECFLAVEEDGKAVTDHFLCRACNQWKAVSHTLHHISSHYSIVKHSETGYLQKHQMTSQRAREIRQALIWFFAQHGVSLQLIDSSDIQMIAGNIPHRHTLRRIIALMAEEFF